MSISFNNYRDDDFIAEDAEISVLIAAFYKQVAQFVSSLKASVSVSELIKMKNCNRSIPPDRAFRPVISKKVIKVMGQLRHPLLLAATALYILSSLNFTLLQQ